MKTQHTPGPWTFGKSKGMHVYVYPKDSTQPLFDYKVSTPWPNKTADLQLIATAPELLKIVRALNDWYKAAPNGPGPSPAALLFDDDDSLDTHIERAIAKAEGKV